MLLAPSEQIEPELLDRPATRQTGNARVPLGWKVPFLLVLWLGIFFASLWSPALLDDADATHAEAAQAMLRTGDWVTLHVDGIRYLEKPPLPYWLAAFSLRIFGPNAFAIHFPLALAVLGLALLAYFWSRRAFGTQAAFYAGLAVLTATGVFLFTRIFIPEALLSLFLLAALYCILRALDFSEHHSARFAYSAWLMMALAVLTKGLVAIVFLVGAAGIYIALTGEWRNARRLRPLSGLLLFLAVAAPWHILAGIRNTGGSNGHGFFWFYFVNEHVLRFLGRRIPRDYNKLPWYLYWPLHIVWLFPWGLFVPAALLEGWGRRRELLKPRTDAQRSALILLIFSVLLLVFFSLSTNQEYYTFPAYVPLLMLIAAALSRVECQHHTHRRVSAALDIGFASFIVIGAAAAAALAYGLWSSRHLPSVPDIGTLLDRRGVGSYTLSMSHFFDLTGASFAALRQPASIAMVALALGPGTAWALRAKRKQMTSIIAVGLTSAAFLVAAHVALVRFSSVLSSRNFAQEIQQLQGKVSLERDSQVLLYGDHAYGSSIPFYLGTQVILVDGRSTSMLFGSTFPDAPPIFWTHGQLVSSWGRGTRKVLFVPQEKRGEVDALLGKRQIILDETSGKALITDRPLHSSPPDVH